MTKRERETSNPILRLAVSNDGMPSNMKRYAMVFDKQPTIRLAHVPGAQGDNNLLGQRGVDALPDTSLPAILVSYYYITGFLDQQEKYRYRDWMMDSGAFSAYNSGAEIDLHEYIDICHLLRKEDPTLAEIIALDVIGSGEGSLKNAIVMREAGLDVIPVFHIGEDWGILKEYCAGWNKVGLSCRFGEPITQSYKFYDQCFARAWPKKFHSFGWMDEKMLMKYPFHSADSSSWEVGPCAFGNWKYFGKLPIYGSNQNLKTQVDWYLGLEERLRGRWRKEMALLREREKPPQSDSLIEVQDVQASMKSNPEIRLVVGTGRSVRDEGIKALGGKK